MTMRKKWKLHEIGEKTGLYAIDDFLTAEECGILIRMSEKKGLSSKAVLLKKSHEKQNPGIKKVSITGWLDEGVSKTVDAINRRTSEITGFPHDHGEPLKVLCYDIGGKLLPHTDYHTYKHYSAGRVGQMLIYLNDVKDGGETEFPNIGVRVIPKRGRALLWYAVKNLIPITKKGDKFTLPKVLRKNPYAVHAACGIRKGKKYIAVKFFHGKPWQVPPTEQVKRLD